MKDVSIIIPAFNQTIELFRQAVSSAINQYGVRTEVIIVDDGSTDGCVDEILDDFEDRVIVFKHDSNRGVAAALNSGIKIASHEYIAWLSSDDYFYPEKTIVQLANMLETKTLFSFTGFREITHRGKKIIGFTNWKLPYGYSVVGQKTLYHDLLDRFPSSFINGASVIFHKSVLDDVGMFDEQLTYMQDYDMWLRIAKKYEGLSCQDVLMVKNSHDNQMMYIFGQDHFKQCREREVEILKSKHGLNVK